MPELLTRRVGSTTYVPDVSRPAAATEPAPSGTSIWTWQARLLFAAGLAILLSHAFVPLAEFVHRGDDAFYYFKVAAAYPKLGFWSFDGVEPTNGVQPLWAILLTVIAQVAWWLGIESPHVLDRVFIAFTGLVQLAAAVALYAVLARRVTPGTALAAAGAFLLPLATVWGRVWGVESPLLALALVAVVGTYLGPFRERPSVRTALLLGAVLGLAGLSRLNAGLLIPIVLVHHLLFGPARPFADRFRDVIVSGLAATAVVVPYFAWNLVHTGHLLPVSGVVKTAGVEQALAEWGAPGRFSRGMLSFVYSRWNAPAEWFTSLHLLDSLWVTGVRLVTRGATSWTNTAVLLGALLLAPAALGRPREWFRFLRARVALLAPFAFFALYAVLDAVVSVFVYPTQAYAITRWWLVSTELLLATASAVVVVAALAYAGERLPAPRRAALAGAAFVALVLGHAGQHVRWYWDGAVRFEDWNLSWNDESYRAARWIDDNVPAGALVGSWNAGVVGWYTSRQVVNLDGLINNERLVPYLREDRVADYILERDIRYLSDMGSHTRRKVPGLRLTPVYTHHSAFMQQDYIVYRVDGRATVAEATP